MWQPFVFHSGVCAWVWCQHADAIKTYCKVGAGRVLQQTGHVLRGHGIRYRRHAPPGPASRLSSPGDPLGRQGPRSHMVAACFAVLGEVASGGSAQAPVLMTPATTGTELMLQHALDPSCMQGGHSRGNTASIARSNGCAVYAAKARWMAQQWSWSEDLWRIMAAQSNCGHAQHQPGAWAKSPARLVADAQRS